MPAFLVARHSGAAPSGPNPESRHMLRASFRIPGSRPSARPGMTIRRALSPVFFGRRRVRRSSPSFTLPKRGAERRQTRGCARPPVSDRRDRPVGRCAKASPPFLSEERRLPALHLRRSNDARAALSVRGPATPVSQLLAPGRNARERSPAIARELRVTFPRSPRRRIGQAAGFPRLADPVRRGRISGPCPTAAPSSRRPMTTPLIRAGRPRVDI